MIEYQGNQSLSSMQIFLFQKIQSKAKKKLPVSLNGYLHVHCISSYCVVPENIHTPPTEGFWFASPHPFGISVPRGSLMTPLPPGISTLREHGFCCNSYYYNIHFQHITLCYCSILFACLLSGLKCSMFFTKICLNRVF